LSESTPEAVANSFTNAEPTVIVGHGIDMDPASPIKFQLTQRLSLVE